MSARRSLLAPLLATLLAASVSAGLAQQQDSLPPGYAGSETCGICHEVAAQNFRTNAHRRIETRDGGKLRGQECESCHGQGSTHSETTDASEIIGFHPDDKTRVNDTCLSCHAGEQTHRGRLNDAHNRNALGCVDCHSVHQAKAEPLLLNETDALCSSCHADVRAAFNRPHRHRLEEKAISCVDCHNPHGGPPPAQTQRVWGNEPGCLKCHGDKRGPFPFEHAPVKLENCSVCHEPHGSANPRMLLRHETSQLCLECHAGSLSALGGIPPAFHDLRSARFQNCTVCHSKIHGSYISRDFLR